MGSIPGYSIRGRAAAVRRAEVDLDVVDAERWIDSETAPAAE
jgi:hypothetical protein